MKELQSVGVNAFITDMKKEYASAHNKTHLVVSEHDESVIQLAWRCRKTTHYNGSDNSLLFGELHALTATANLAVVYEMNQTDETDDVILSLVIYDGTNRIKLRSYSAPFDDAVIYLMGNLHEQAKAIVAAVNDMSVFHA